MIAVFEQVSQTLPQFASHSWLAQTY